MHFEFIIMRKRYIFIKFLAYLVLASGFLCLLLALGGAVYSWLYFKDANIGKKVLLEIVILIFGLLGLLSGLGLYQYLVSFIKVGQEIRKIEDEVEDLEDKVGR